MLQYDEPKLIGRLEALSPRARVAFAAACAERLRAYFGYPDSPPTPRQVDAALEALGRAIRTERPDASLQSAVQACEASLDIDDDAVAAIIYAWSALGSDGARAAARAARRGYEARDRLVSDSLGVDFNVEGAEHLVLAHPIVQAELKRQVDDLELLSASSEQASAVLERARTLAKVRDAV
ncbi:MAG TPA: hypothetical protein VIE41_19745 [Methylomirabilota bacterium]|jgi:hypothetical protein